MKKKLVKRILSVFRKCPNTSLSIIGTGKNLPYKSTRETYPKEKRVPELQQIKVHRIFLAKGFGSSKGRYDYEIRQNLGPSKYLMKAGTISAQKMKQLVSKYGKRISPSSEDYARCVRQERRKRK
jgi:hypothetical protein